MYRFKPVPEIQPKSRMDIIAWNISDSCYTKWTCCGEDTFAMVYLSPNSICMATRTLLHEVIF